MGSSMNAPSQQTLRRHQSRLSTRSVQKDSKRSYFHDKKSSHSTNKMPHNSRHSHHQVNQTLENTQLRNEELKLMSRYEQPQISIREANHIKTQKASFGGETEPKSPNFKSVANAGCQYGLGQWSTNTNSKAVLPMDLNNQELTISFSKAKNFPNNLFHEEASIRKSGLKNILEQGEEDVLAQNSVKENKKEQYLEKQIDQIQSLKSFCSENFKTPFQSIELQSKCNKNELELVSNLKENSVIKNSKHLLKKTESKRQQLRQEAVKLSKIEDCQTVKPTIPFNDYDTQFGNTSPQAQHHKNGIKLSKKILQLKEKITSRLVQERQNNDVSRGSLKSGRNKHRESCSFDKSRDSQRGSRVQRIREKLCRTQLIQEQNGLQQAILPSSLKDKLKKKIAEKKSEIRLAKSQHHIQDVGLRKILSPVLPSQKSQLKSKIVLKKNKLEGSSKLNEQSKITFRNTFKIIAQPDTRPIDDHQQQQKKPSQFRECKYKGKKLDFTELVKKEHINHIVKKAKSGSILESHIKFSHVVESTQSNKINSKIFASGVSENRLSLGNEEYQLFDNREKNKKSQKIVDVHAKKSNIDKLKKNIQKLNRQHPKLLSSTNSNQARHSQQNSIQQVSIKNKTTLEKSYHYDDRHPGNKTTTNYQQMLASLEEYMLTDTVALQKKQRNTYGHSDRKKHRSLEQSNSFSSKNKLIIF